MKPGLVLGPWVPLLLLVPWFPGILFPWLPGPLCPWLPGSRALCQGPMEPAGWLKVSQGTEGPRIQENSGTQGGQETDHKPTNQQPTNEPAAEKQASQPAS